MNFALAHWIYLSFAFLGSVLVALLFSCLNARPAAHARPFVWKVRCQLNFERNAAYLKNRNLPAQQHPAGSSVSVSRVCAQPMLIRAQSQTLNAESNGQRVSARVFNWVQLFEWVSECLWVSESLWVRKCSAVRSYQAMAHASECCIYDVPNQLLFTNTMPAQICT